jgi:crotonobetainyl-CoA:carnitine CoA-transferase CaiB-like acyl-CoA transferase
MLTAPQLEALHAIRSAATAMAVKVARINETIRAESLPVSPVAMPHQLGALIDAVDYEIGKAERAAQSSPLAGMLA